MQLLMLSLALIAGRKVESRTARTHRRDTRQGSQLRPAIQSQALRRTLTNGKMAVLSFSLTPEATGRIYEALVCLAKFGESVAIEARGDKVRRAHHRVYKRDFTDVAIVHADCLESFQDGICLVCTRCAFVLH